MPKGECNVEPVLCVITSWQPSFASNHGLHTNKKSMVSWVARFRRLAFTPLQGRHPIGVQAFSESIDKVLTILCDAAVRVQLREHRLVASCLSWSIPLLAMNTQLLRLRPVNCMEMKNAQFVSQL